MTGKTDTKDHKDNDIDMSNFREQVLVLTIAKEGCLDLLNKDRKDDVGLFDTIIAVLDGSLHMVPKEHFARW